VILVDPLLGSSTPLKPILNFPRRQAAARVAGDGFEIRNNRCRLKADDPQGLIDRKSPDSPRGLDPTGRSLAAILLSGPIPAIHDVVRGIGGTIAQPLPAGTKSCGTGVLVAKRALRCSPSPLIEPVRAVRKDGKLANRHPIAAADAIASLPTAPVSHRPWHVRVPLVRLETTQAAGSLSAPSGLARRCDLKSAALGFYDCREIIDHEIDGTKIEVVCLTFLR
jgi:hypothetical protein